MKASASLIALLLLAGCGGGAETPVAANESVRVERDLQRQVERISQEAENGAAAIERAMENEGAVIFENRGNLLNESTDGDTEAR